jgi:hypothetical protein
MKINEITQAELQQFLKKSKKGKWAPMPKPEDTSDFLPHQIENWLKKNDFRKLGKGLYSSTWLHKTGKYVVKINKDSDPAWAAYAQFCQQHKSPHFLKVYSLKQFKVRGKTYFLALMEPLYKTKIPTRMMKDLQYYGEYLDFELARKREKRDPEFVMGIKEIEREYPSLTKAMFLLEKGIKTRRPQFGWDIHRNNIMQRANGQLVFSDPIA